MAVLESDLVVGPLTPAAGVTTISLDFYFEQASWLEVYKSGSETPLVLNTDYTVTGAGTGAGVVTLAVAANGTDAYSVYLIVPLQRSSDMQLRGGFKSGPFNTELDRLWQAIQGINTRVAQSLRISRTSLVVGPLATGSAAARAGRALVFGASGSDLGIGPTAAEIASAQSFAASAGTSATEAADSAAEAAASAASATGDVEGPASATNNHVALFNGATGKLIKSGGFAFTAAGQAIAAATDAAAQRTALELGTAALLADSVDANLANVPAGAARRSVVAEAIAAGAVLTKSYASSGQTITSGGLITLAHGMGIEPKIVQYILQCIIADSGYSVGDRITVGEVGKDRANNARLDATNIVIRYFNGTAAWEINGKDWGGDVPANNSRWQLYVRAFA